MGDDQRPPEVVLEERAEDEAEQERRRLAAELDQAVAEDPEERDRVDVERVEVDRVGPDAGEGDDRREQDRGTGPSASRTQMPISGRFSMTSSRLPTHIETIRPQNSAGSLTMTFGPV